MIFPTVWNYGKLSAKFLVSRVKDIDTAGFLSFFSSFTRTTIKIPLKFLAFTFNKPKGWSISASNTEANSAAFIVGDHLNFADTSGGSQKFYSYSRGITKILQNLKNFQRSPLQVKNDTFLKGDQGFYSWASD